MRRWSSHPFSGIDWGREECCFGALGLAPSGPVTQGFPSGHDWDQSNRRPSLWRGCWALFEVGCVHLSVVALETGWTARAKHATLSCRVSRGRSVEWS